MNVVLRDIAIRAHGCTSDAEIEAGFAELLRTVSEMEFTADEMRKNPSSPHERRLSEFCDIIAT